MIHVYDWLGVVNVIYRELIYSLVHLLMSFVPPGVLIKSSNFLSRIQPRKIKDTGGMVSG